MMDLEKEKVKISAPGAGAGFGFGGGAEHHPSSSALMVPLSHLPSLPFPITQFSTEHLFLTLCPILDSQALGLHECILRTLEMQCDTWAFARGALQTHIRLEFLHNSL